MIVISGALVLVALVLLVIGLIGPSLGFVYASIAVSLASFAFLIVGILQRRKEDLQAAADGGTDVLAVAPSAVTALVAAEESAEAPTIVRKPALATESSAGSVLIVAGRPRYHVEGCRYLTGKDAEKVDVAGAREEGFTACGVCKPDEQLAATTAVAEETAEVEAAVEAEVVEAAATAPTRVARAADPITPPVTKAPAKTPVTKAAAKAPVTKSVTKSVTKPVTKSVTKPVTKPATKAEPKAAAKAAPAKKAAAAPVKRGLVIVIPARGKFHTADCRYVRGAEDTLELTKAAATKQGYDACGVCNP